MTLDPMETNSLCFAADMSIWHQIECVQLFTVSVGEGSSVDEGSEIGAIFRNLPGIDSVLLAYIF